MPEHYSPKLFLQQIPKKLLREFFTRRGELGDLNWDGLEEADVDPILTAADSEGCRSAFRADVDHDSEVMPIGVPNGSRSVLRL